MLQSPVFMLSEAFVLSESGFLLRHPDAFSNGTRIGVSSSVELSMYMNGGINIKVKGLERSQTDHSLREKRFCMSISSASMRIRSAPQETSFS